MFFNCKVSMNISAFEYCWMIDSSKKYDEDDLLMMMCNEWITLKIFGIFCWCQAENDTR